LLLLCSYDHPWDEKKPVLNTCNPGRMIAVSHSLSPQEVRETAEIIFTYDVKFTVSNCQV
jgi:transmembrane 9 superfamily protein 2/4